MWQAQKFGFFMYDIQEHEAAKWQKLTIITKAEEWPTKALDVVALFSDDVIRVNSDDDGYIETALPPKMTALTEAA
jgi:hypothetical protein